MFTTKEISATSRSSVSDIPTVIFVPQYQYVKEEDLDVRISGGRYTLDWPSQTLLYYHNAQADRHVVALTRRVNKASSSEDSHEGRTAGSNALARADSGHVC